MKFRLTVDLSNAAFTENPDELAEILRSVADRVERGGDEGKPMDSNGNTVGAWSIR